MQEKFLGDSYDLVKRFWAERLPVEKLLIAPLYAHPQFVPVAIRPRFCKLTKMKMFDPDNCPEGEFGLFLDPDTGIPLPDGSHREVTVKHAPLTFIVQEIKHLQPAYTICFDQSHHRAPDVGKSEQMKKKMEFLQNEGLHSFGIGL